MKAQTYHPFTVGRQARKGGGGSSVQVIDNLNSTSSTAALSANQGRQLKIAIDEGKVKKELLEVTDLTFIWNEGRYTSDEDTGIHNGFAYKRLSIENAILSIKFKGFYTKDSQGNYSKIRDVLGQPQIKENGAIPEYGYLWKETDVNFVENPYGFSGVGKPAYNNLTYPYADSPSGYIAATYSEFEYNNSNNVYVELVLLTQNQGAGTTEQQVRDLYNWPNGVIGLFEITYI